MEPCTTQSPPIGAPSTADNGGWFLEKRSADATDDDLSEGQFQNNSLPRVVVICPKNGR